MISTTRRSRPVAEPLVIGILGSGAEIGRSIEQAHRVDLRRDIPGMTCDATAPPMLAKPHPEIVGVLIMVRRWGWEDDLDPLTQEGSKSIVLERSASS